jgi:prepilin peptidase CpaA
MTQLPNIAVVILVCLVAAAGISDLRTRRIPNWLTVSGVLAGLALNTFLFGLSGLGHSAAGLALAFGIYIVLYSLRAMGAGDVKLMAAVGSIVGPGDWFGIFLITAVIGGISALALILWRKRTRKTFANVTFILGEMMHMRPAYMAREELSVNSPAAVTMPHGTVIALGSIFFLIWAATGVV